MMEHKSIYIASSQPRSGSLLVAIGIMEMLKGHYGRVAFFRPVIENPDTEDENIRSMIEHFRLDIDYASCVGFSAQSYVQAYTQGTLDGQIEMLIEKYKALESAYDFVLIEGFPRSYFSPYFDFDLNVLIAQNLSSAYIAVIQAHNKSCQLLQRELQTLHNRLEKEACHHIATFLNRVSHNQIRACRKLRPESGTTPPYFFIPDAPELDRPTLLEVVEHLGATRINGSDDAMQQWVKHKQIAAMDVESYASSLKEGSLVIVPSDRSEIILFSLLAQQSHSSAHICALLLSDSGKLSETIEPLVQDLEIALPIIATHYTCYDLPLVLEEIKPSISHLTTKKITLAKALFDAHVDKEVLVSHCRAEHTDILTPMMFQYRILEQARRQKERILLPETQDARILHAAETLLRRNIVQVMLLGDKQSIEERAKRLGISLGGATYVNADDTTLKTRFAKRYYTLRKHKGITPQQAEEIMESPTYFATMMVAEGYADGMVCGATHTTADTLRPALQIIKTDPQTPLVSSIFFLCLKQRVLVYGDCALNLDPDAEALANIALSSAQTARQFGIDPKVAMLSYSTGDSGKGPDVEKVRKATDIVRKRDPKLPVEGPIQYDAAIDPEVARQKLPQSQVAGKATVFIFPDLNTGNNTYKAVQRATGAIAIGPVLQGLRLPVNDLSRGCSVEDIVNTVAITAIQAHHLKEKR